MAFGPSPPSGAQACWCSWGEPGAGEEPRFADLSPQGGTTGRSVLVDRAHRLWNHPGAWGAQWIWLAVAAPYLLYEGVAPTWGWVGVCLLVLQQGFRCLDLEERRRRLDLDVTWPAVGLAGIAIPAYFSSPDRVWSLPLVQGLLWNI